MKRNAIPGLLLVAWVFPCLAGGDTYVAFDRSRCEMHWVEFDGGSPPEGYARYDPGASQPQAFYWTPATVAKSDGSHVTGLCKLVYQGAGRPRYYPAHCETKPGFALSGASYTVASKGEVFNFRCTSGCEGAPSWLYLEPNEVQANPRYERARRAYGSKCGFQ